MKALHVTSLDELVERHFGAAISAHVDELEESASGSSDLYVAACLVELDRAVRDAFKPQRGLFPLLI